MGDEEEGDMDAAAATIHGWVGSSWRLVFARVVELSGCGGSSQAELFAVNELGESAGGLLGGAKDSELVPVMRQVLAGPPRQGIRTLTVELHGEAAMRAGLSCGGAAEVLIQTADGIPWQFWTAVAERRPVTLANTIEGRAASPQALAVTADGRRWGSLGDGAADSAVAEAAAGLLGLGQRTIRWLHSERGTVLLEAMVPDPRLVVVGAGSVADAIVFQAAVLDWQCRVAGDLDGAETHLAWAGDTGAVVVLSHDPDLDAPALAAAFRHRTFYLGAMGSRRTQAARAARLRALGVADTEVARIRGPVGLDLGGQTPALIALAVCAEIQAVRAGRQATPLRDGEGPIRDRRSRPVSP
jgi:xanthine dehydrogenase accessory factor